MDIAPTWLQDRPPVCIALDAMGGDAGPAVNVEGAVAAVRELGLGVILVGVQEEIRRHLDRYDVMMAGRRVPLTYKEFQLLVLLASNPGRVYTREALLSQVWGYDYLGGTRTVDVHIRRVRSKIEDPDHTFVETIWNVGYRFKTSPSGGGKWTEPGPSA